MLKFYSHIQFGMRPTLVTRDPSLYFNATSEKLDEQTICIGLLALKH